MYSKLLIICEWITRFAAYPHSPNCAEYKKNGSAKESLNNCSSLLSKPHLLESCDYKNYHSYSKLYTSTLECENSLPNDTPCSYFFRDPLLSINIPGDFFQK